MAMIKSEAKRVGDLAEPIVAAKADWKPNEGWLGFTPTGNGPDAVAQCQATINRQSKGGYIVEYITEEIGVPNKGFEDHPSYLADKEEHEKYKGRLIAIHKLKYSALPLSKIVGDEKNQELQQIWRGDSSHERWSVAFPIVQSYKLVGLPIAKEVMGTDFYNWLFKHPSSALRPIPEEIRKTFAELSIQRCTTKYFHSAVDQEIGFAEGSDLNPSVENDIGNDFDLVALEGAGYQKVRKLIKRATWLAQKFAAHRQKTSTLFCDDCGFDPAGLFKDAYYRPRSLLDVHHKDPLAEGVRYTDMDDFAMLCPTCHRKEHVRLKLQKPEP